MAPADGPQDDEEFDAAPERRVERYVAGPISEDVRRRLEEFLADHPEFDESRCIGALIGLGLDRAELPPPPDGQNTKKASDMLALAEKLLARAKRTCGR